MNYMYSVKEEHLEPSSSMTPTPQPMEGLHDIGPPPFLTKTFDVVDSPTTNHVVSWSRGGTSLVVWDTHAFSTSLLPRYFKQNNFSSFVRQLNTYEPTFLAHLKLLAIHYLLKAYWNMIILFGLGI